MTEILGDPEELMAMIHRKAEQEAINLKAEVQQRSERQRAAAVAEGERIRADILQKAATAVAAARQRQLAQAELENQHRYLQARQALLDQVWHTAEKQLRELTVQPAYLAILQRLALHAAQILGPGTITLASDAHGHALLTADTLTSWGTHAGFAGDVTFARATDPLDSWGGLVARHADGRRQVDATFATRLSLARATLNEQVAQRLAIG